MTVGVAVERGNRQLVQSSYLMSVVPSGFHVGCAEVTTTWTHQANRSTRMTTSGRLCMVFSEYQARGTRHNRGDTCISTV